MKAKGKQSEGSKENHVLVAISGGVHSAVTAALLRSQGHEVSGVHFSVYNPKSQPETRFNSRCCLTKSEASAEKVCAELGIPFYKVDLEGPFEEKVVDYAVHDVLQLRVPNPCIPCNRDIRFEALFRKADELGLKYVATGHHAQVFHEINAQGAATAARLQRGVSPSRDQSYFLFGLSQDQLLRVLMPLGGLQETMIQRLAQEYGVPSESAGDPQGICFIQDDSYLKFVENKSPSTLRNSGLIKLTDGTLLGEHKGLYTYQLGQRPELSAKIKGADDLVVIGFDPQSATLYAGAKSLLTQQELRASRATWVRRLDELRDLQCLAQLSPTQRELYPCRVTRFENRTIRVEFAEPAYRVLPGQAIVFYENDEVLGGAWVDHVGGLSRAV